MMQMINVQLVFKDGHTKDITVSSEDRVRVLYKYSRPGDYFLCGEKFLYDDFRIKAFGLRNGDKIRVYPSDLLPSQDEFFKIIKLDQQRSQVSRYLHMATL